jgi:hypothetical protein
VLRVSLRSVGAAVATLLSAAGAVTSVASPAVASAASPAGTGFSVTGVLSGVTAPLANNAWAVGTADKGGSLIARWNGRAWQRVPGVPGNGLIAVAATSARNAWAVGATETLTVFRPLILHWNGRTWSRATIRTPAHAFLEGVAATSATNAWAVGGYGTGLEKTLILHWNGRTWAQVPSPTPAGKHQGALLTSVAAVSATDAWAVGATESGVAGSQRGLILRWNGRTWKAASGKALAAASQFLGVAATSGSAAWAIGCACAGGPGGVVIVRWNGSSWSRSAVPVPPLESSGSAVAAASARSAWAVGVAGSTSLILGWNGKAWRRMPHSAPPDSILSAVAVTSARSAWAVGIFGNGPPRTLIVHWNGRIWT